MARAMTRLQIEPVETSHDSALIDRYLGAQQHAWQLRYAGIPTESPLAGVSVELIDTTDHPKIRVDSAMLWHVLWVRDEHAATVTLTTDGRDQSWPIAPGDTFAVPERANFVASGGQLALAIQVSGGMATISQPTHGIEQFFGHNRQTIASELGNARVCRWKLTQPLALNEHYRGLVLVMSLARTAVLRTERRIEQILQGEAAIIDPSTGPIVTPDGLAYLLTIDLPNQE